MTTGTLSRAGATTASSDLHVKGTLGGAINAGLRASSRPTTRSC